MGHTMAVALPGGAFLFSSHTIDYLNSAYIYNMVDAEAKVGGVPVSSSLSLSSP